MVEVVEDEESGREEIDREREKGGKRGKNRHKVGKRVGNGASEKGRERF